MEGGVAVSGSGNGRGVARVGAVVAAAVLLLALGAGCTRISFERLQLGAEPKDYETAFPRVDMRRTDLGLAYLTESKQGQTDAVALLIGLDRRLIGKLRLTAVDRDWTMPPQQGVKLVGELDARRYGVAELSPTEALLVVMSDLLTETTTPRAREAHDWLEAGVLRVYERISESPPPDYIAKAVEPLRDRVLEGGDGDVIRAETGVMYIRYEAGAVPR